MNRRNFLTSGAIGLTSTALPPFAEVKQSSSISYHQKENNYSKPYFPQGTRLLFQGDSITDMKWGRNQADRNHYLGHSYVFLIAGRLGLDMPKANLEFFNRGISGNKVSDLRARWQKDAIDMKPDMLSILVGTNDVGIGFRNKDKTVTPSAFEEDYRFILEASLKANPSLRIVLMDPFVLQSGSLKDEQAYHSRRKETDKMRNVVSRMAMDYNAAHLKTQEILDRAVQVSSPENLIWDGIHPLPQGHELIARNWIDLVARHWAKS
ncbi:MAG: SGNH/GDSL hydrolase family protein [Opitutales bacterium]|nr:SGNH/GDSL hydrolase family protein [Opitutales bacterium]